MLYNILLILQIIVSVAIIGLVLMQHGKGADAGAAFGSGASGSVFGSQGSANFLSRTTAVLAAVFFINCIGLAWIVADNNAPDRGSSSIMESVQQNAPAVNSEVPTIPGEETAPAAGDTSNSEVPAAPAASSEEVPAAPAATQEAAPAPAAAPENTQQQQPAATQTEVPAAPAPAPAPAENDNTVDTTDTEDKTTQ